MRQILNVHTPAVRRCARLLLGEKIDITEHATAASTMVRIATRLGLERQAKEIGPSLGDMLRPSKGQYERGRLP